MLVPKPIVEIFGDVVAAVRAELLPYLKSVSADIHDLNYQYGPLEEIKETLKAYDEDKQNRKLKYPLVLLVQDFPEDFGKANGRYADVTLPWAIVNQTELEFKAAERYEHNLKPILYPILEAMIQAINKSPAFATAGVSSIKFRKIDRVSVGREKFLKLDDVAYDYLDAIEIHNMRLRINFKNCSKPITQILGK